MIIFHILNKNWVDAAEWAKLCQPIFDGQPMWLHMLYYYCLEQQGKVDRVKESFLEHVNSMAGLGGPIAEYFGIFALRNNFKDKAFTPFKEFALENIAYKAKLIDKSGLLDLEWYKEHYLSDNAVLGGKAQKMHPIIHYQYYGVFEGALPNRYFDSLRYTHDNNKVISSGINPLVHFIVYGNQDMVDPCPQFSMKRYLYAHPELEGKNWNFLAHFLKTERHAADKLAAELAQAV